MLRLVYDGDVLGKFPDGVLWASLGPKPHLMGLLGSWAAGLGMSEKEIAGLLRIEDRQQAIKSRIGMSRMLLVIDDAWDVDAANTFLLGGPHSAHVLTTRLPSIAWEFAHDGVVTLAPLTEDEGMALLAEMAPMAVKSEPEETRKLVSAVGGLPLALVIMGRYLAHEGRTGRPRRVRAALESLRDSAQRLRLEAPSSLLEASPTLPEGTPLSLLASVALSVCSLDSETRRVMRALSVLRAMPHSFDEGAAAAVTGAEPSVLDRLEDIGLLESVGPDRYALQPAIADFARSQLTDEEAKEFHRRALDYVNGKLREHEESLRDVAPYQRQYRYEQPGLADLEEEFLYHVSHSGRRVGRSRFRAGVPRRILLVGLLHRLAVLQAAAAAVAEHPASPESLEWIDAFSTFEIRIRPATRSTAWVTGPRSSARYTGFASSRSSTATSSRSRASSGDTSAR